MSTIGAPSDTAIMVLIKLCICPPMRLQSGQILSLIDISLDWIGFLLHVYSSCPGPIISASLHIVKSNIIHEYKQFLKRINPNPHTTNNK